MSIQVVAQNYFDMAFTVGATLPTKDGEAVIEQFAIGDLYLPTGHIVACDPLTLWQAEPFSQRVQPGRYSVTLSLVQFPKSRWKHVAFARLSFAVRQPVSWQMALKPGQDPSTLADDEFYGYGVDTGTGAFLDIEAVKLLQKKVEQDYDAVLETMLNGRHAALGATIMLDDLTGINFAAFSSGFGDGTYPSYWGYDNAGGIVCLVTDFGLLLGINEEME